MIVFIILASTTVDSPSYQFSNPFFSSSIDPAFYFLYGVNSVIDHLENSGVTSGLKCNACMYVCMYVLVQMYKLNTISNATEFLFSLPSILPSSPSFLPTCLLALPAFLPFSQPAF